MTTPHAVQSFVHAFTPASAGRTDALLLLHGTGGDEHSLMKLGDVLSPGAARLAPRGKVLEGTMPRFFRRLREGVFDEEDVKRRAAELAAWIHVALPHYGLSSQETTIVGYSNGANIAAAMLILVPSVVQRAVLLRPMVPLEGVTPPKLQGVSVMLSAGRHDPITPPQSAQRLATMLEAAGARTVLHLDGGDHMLPREAIVAAQDWVRDNSSPAPRAADA